MSDKNLTDKVPEMKERKGSRKVSVPGRPSKNRESRREHARKESQFYIDSFKRNKRLSSAWANNISTDDQENVMELYKQALLDDHKTKLSETYPKEYSKIYTYELEFDDDDYLIKEETPVTSPTIAKKKPPVKKAKAGPSKPVSKSTTPDQIISPAPKESEPFNKPYDEPSSPAAVQEEVMEAPPDVEEYQDLTHQEDSREVVVEAVEPNSAETYTDVPIPRDSIDTDSNLTYREASEMDMDSHYIETPPTDTSLVYHPPDNSKLYGKLSCKYCEKDWSRSFGNADPYVTVPDDYYTGYDNRYSDESVFLDPLAPQEYYPTGERTLHYEPNDADRFYSKEFPSTFYQPDQLSIHSSGGRQDTTLLNRHDKKLRFYLENGSDDAVSRDDDKLLRGCGRVRRGDISKAHKGKVKGDSDELQCFCDVCELQYSGESSKGPNSRDKKFHVNQDFQDLASYDISQRPEEEGLSCGCPLPEYPPNGHGASKLILPSGDVRLHDLASTMMNQSEPPIETYKYTNEQNPDETCTSIYDQTLHKVYTSEYYEESDRANVCIYEHSPHKPYTSEHNEYITKSHRSFYEQRHKTKYDSSPDKAYTSCYEQNPQNTFKSDYETIPHKVHIPGYDQYPDESYNSEHEGIPENTYIPEYDQYPEKTYEQEYDQIPNKTYTQGYDQIPNKTYTQGYDQTPDKTYPHGYDQIPNKTYTQRYDQTPNKTYTQGYDQTPDKTDLYGYGQIPNTTNEYGYEHISDKSYANECDRISSKTYNRGYDQIQDKTYALDNDQVVSKTYTHGYDQITNETYTDRYDPIPDQTYTHGYEPIPEKTDVYGYDQIPDKTFTCGFDQSPDKMYTSEYDQSQDKMYTSGCDTYQDVIAAETYSSPAEGNKSCPRYKFSSEEKISRSSRVCKVLDNNCEVWDVDGCQTWRYAKPDRAPSAVESQASNRKHKKRSKSSKPEEKPIKIFKFVVDAREKKVTCCLSKAAKKKQISSSKQWRDIMFDSEESFVKQEDIYTEIHNSHLRETCHQMDKSLEHGSRYPAGLVNRCPCGQIVNSFNGHLARFPSGHLPGCPGSHSGHVDGCPGNTNWTKGHLANCPAGQRVNCTVGHVARCPIVQSVNWSSGTSNGCNGVQRNCMPSSHGHATGCETVKESIGPIIKCPCGQFFRPSCNQVTRCPCGVTFKSTFSQVVSYPCSPAVSHPSAHTFRCPTNHQAAMHPLSHAATARHPAPNACHKIHESNTIPVQCTRTFPCETEPSDEDCSNDQDDESEEVTEIEENLSYKSVLKNRTSHYLSVDKDGTVRDHRLTFQNVGCHDKTANPCNKAHPLVTRKSLKHCPPTLDSLSDRAPKGLLLYCTPVDFCIIDEQCNVAADSHLRHASCDRTYSAKTNSQHSTGPCGSNHKESENSKIVYETLKYQSADDEFRPKRRLHFNSCEEPNRNVMFIPVNKKESFQSGHCETPDTKYSVQETIQLPATEQNQVGADSRDSVAPDADIFL
ncbi:hypothetical protein Btru_043572 [Bulinus truncatus]|nr:hypothetical protein Btru_043572 [Bulinus truncatus]